MTRQNNFNKFADPYRHCEQECCGHELLRGVLIGELFGGPGPYRPYEASDSANETATEGGSEQQHNQEPASEHQSAA